MPMTIDGTPFSKSAVYRTTAGKLPLPNSERYTPATNPAGTPIRTVSRSSFPVPTMAFAIPPPASPGGLGSCVRKLQLSERPPYQSRYPRMKKSTETVSSAHSPVMPNITVLTILRRFIAPSPAAWC